MSFNKSSFRLLFEIFVSYFIMMMLLLRCGGGCSAFQRILPGHYSSVNNIITTRQQQQQQRLFGRRFSSSSSSSSSTTTTTTLNSSSSSSSYNEYDVIVVGGGHAGCDAAAAAARTGARTALITQRLDTIGELSCNPSIGGIGKGHLVREIDALDGLIGKMADQAGIHYRMLNRRKGPAVRGPRAQMDRDLYKSAMQSCLNAYPNLHLIEASVQDLLLDESSKVIVDSLTPISGTDKVPGSNQLNRQARIRGVLVERTTDEDGSSAKQQQQEEIMSKTVVITTGTFLRGVLMLGHDRYSGGRHLRDSEQVEPPSIGLARTLERYNFHLNRLKTGTPARIDGTTINWDILTAQPTEIPATPFSHLHQYHGLQPPQLELGNYITCYQTSTNEQTHKLVLQYEHTLPIYDGLDGAGNGPRYCPSIYKKVQRFPERSGHNCFLEPEGLNTDLVYPNGMSGPYPEDIQQKILRSMKGLEEVNIIRPGYDVEYDFVNPQSLLHTLETKSIGGLYLAGQICGTTGYEEAAAQGIIAGANAGRSSISSSGETTNNPFVIGRDEGYIGVLIDDLVTRGTSEPYRMFTSRAEYRISLRADNADLRLTKKGADFGLIQDPERLAALEEREYFINDRINKLKNFNLKVTEWAERGSNLMGGKQMKKKSGEKKTAEEILCMPHVTLKNVEDIMVEVSKEIQQQQRSEEENDDGDSNDDNDDNDEEDLVLTGSPPFVFDTVEASVKYQSYVQRQHRDMESWRKAQGVRIPPDLVYEPKTFPSFSSEEIEKLNRIRPTTFADASQISGITPQSLVYLRHHINNRNRKRDGGSSSSSGGSGARDRRNKRIAAAETAAAAAAAATNNNAAAESSSSSSSVA